jgi:hypothetical protein
MTVKIWASFRVSGLGFQVAPPVCASAGQCLPHPPRPQRLRPHSAPVTIDPQNDDHLNGPCISTNTKQIPTSHHGVTTSHYTVS